MVKAAKATETSDGQVEMHLEVRKAGAEIYI